MDRVGEAQGHEGTFSLARVHHASRNDVFRCRKLPLKQNRQKEEHHHWKRTDRTHLIKPLDPGQLPIYGKHVPGMPSPTSRPWEAPQAGQPGIGTTEIVPERKPRTGACGRDSEGTGRWRPQGFGRSGREGPSAVLTAESMGGWQTRLLRTL